MVNKITTMKDIEEKQAMEENKPMVKKLTPEEIKARRVQVDVIKMEILNNARQIEVWEKDLVEDIPNKKVKIEIRKKIVDNEAKECDIKTHNRIVRDSERS